LALKAVYERHIFSFSEESFLRYWPNGVSFETCSILDQIPKYVATKQMVAQIVDGIFREREESGEEETSPTIREEHFNRVSLRTGL
jgi:hypothetical protein